MNLRLAVYAAGWIVPAGDREAWRSKWTSRARDWRVLVDRGELAASGGIPLLRRIFADALAERFPMSGVQRLLRAPLWMAAACLLPVLAIAVCSGGFRMSRTLMALARDVRLHPDLGFPYDIRGDRLFEYFTPIAVAGAVGLALLFVRRQGLRSLGWRSWALLAFKVATLYAGASLLWVEGGHGLRLQMARHGYRFGVGGLLPAIVFVVVFGFAVLWSIGDQRRRCPVCLRRLLMPVAIGSWASVFDPAATELVCEEGHGSLALMEAETGPAPSDRWIQLDASWRYLFPKAGEAKPNSGDSL